MVKREIVKNELAGWFGEYYDGLEIAATYNLLLNAANMVKHRVGAALCFALDSGYDGLSFVPLAPRLETGAVLAWKKEQAVSVATRQFMKFIKEYILSISSDSI